MQLDGSAPVYSQHPFHQGGMRALRQPGSGKFRKGTRERRFARQLLPHRKTADALQRAIYDQPFNQPGGRRYSQHGLGNKGARQHSPIMLGSPASTPSRTHKLFDTHPFQGMHYLHQFWHQRAQLGSQFGNQFVLNDAPALRNIHSGR